MKVIAKLLLLAGALCWMRSCQLAGEAVGDMNFNGTDEMEQVKTTLLSVTSKLAKSTDWRLLAEGFILAGIIIWFGPSFLRWLTSAGKGTARIMPRSHAARRWRRWKR